MKFNSPRRYSLRNLLAAVAALTLALMAATSVFRWRQGNVNERQAVLEACMHGATYTTESGLAASAGKRPTWIECKFLTGIAKIDFSLAMRRDVAARGITPLPVADEHLRSLKDIRGLRILDLRGSPFTDRAVELLKRLQSLEQLNLRGTRITEGGVQKLREALPACRIEW